MSELTLVCSGRTSSKGRADEPNDDGLQAIGQQKERGLSNTLQSQTGSRNGGDCALSMAAEKSPKSTQRLLHAEALS